MSGRLTHATIRALDWLNKMTLPPVTLPVHQVTGHRGEDDACFYLRKRGYVMVARNSRSPRHRGEIDLIGWDKDVLCFIEVKTRTTRDVKPAEAAVGRGNVTNLPRWPTNICVANHPRASGASTWSACIMIDKFSQPQFELFQNVLLMS